MVMHSLIFYFAVEIDLLTKKKLNLITAKEQKGFELHDSCIAAE